MPVKLRPIIGFVTNPYGWGVCLVIAVMHQLLKNATGS